MVDAWAGLLVARTVSLETERYRLARLPGQSDRVRAMMARSTRLLLSSDWLYTAVRACYAGSSGPVRAIADVDLEYWEDWWMPDDAPKTATAAATLDMFAAPKPAVDLTNPEAVLDAYLALLTAQGIKHPAKVRLVDALEAVRSGTVAGSKSRAKKTSDAAFRTEADRIMRTANAPRVAPGQSWTDKLGAVRYTSWAWIPETNMWSHRLAVSLGIFAVDERGKTRYVGEDHLYGLDQPDHPLHQTWVRERRAYLDLVGVADEYTVTL